MLALVPERVCSSSKGPHGDRFTVRSSLREEEEGGEEIVETLTLKSLGDNEMEMEKRRMVFLKRKGKEENGVG